ncbi:hypothetical protein RvY_08339 [Ramazzottius varieornatus]|uniref:Uncharacterized protein n=1 Tax=Ramazzottius varieornatus TaxID=947166 RepID=A0A1D1V5H5_RAMVA|nr:hypothetical protein RvY_08339 [Ramazzottius varieornatus]
MTSRSATAKDTCKHNGPSTSTRNILGCSPYQIRICRRVENFRLVDDKDQHSVSHETHDKNQTVDQRRYYTVKSVRFGVMVLFQVIPSVVVHLLAGLLAAYEAPSAD